MTAQLNLTPAEVFEIVRSHVENNLSCGVICVDSSVAIDTCTPTGLPVAVFKGLTVQIKIPAKK